MEMEASGGVEPQEGGPPPGSGIADGLLHELDPASIAVGTIVGWIVACILSAGIAAGLLVLWLSVPWPRPALLAATAGGALACLALAVIAVKLPPIEHRYVRYRLDQVGLEIRRGILWRAVISVPRSRVQHTDVNQGPIERRFGLATLVVHTAGTQSSSVQLGGLARETAFAIRDELLAATAEPPR